MVFNDLRALMEPYGAPWLQPVAIKPKPRGAENGRNLIRSEELFFTQIRLSLSGPAEPVLVAIDRQLVTRALNNLLDNALRHTPPAGEVAVSWQPRDGHVEFEIRDNGEGIAAEHLPHVFEPLYKVDTSRSGSTSSAGLGLAIARRLIEVHSGTLSADNITGDGAVLRGTLPQSANALAVLSAAETDDSLRPL